LRRCNALEAKLSAVTAIMEQNESENERCKQTVATFEARIQGKDKEIQRLLEKVSGAQRDADARVKAIQQQLEASEERANSLQQQLHETQQTIMSEKVLRSSDELSLSNFAAEVKLITSSLASAEQQLRSKDSQIFQMQELTNQLHQHLADVDAQKTATQQRLEALRHDLDAHLFRAEAERTQMQTAHSTAIRGLLAEVDVSTFEVQTFIMTQFCSWQQAPVFSRHALA
jgi:chromosome segregation ATPase